MYIVEEIFKDIPGYEQIYQVSNLGRVKSLSRKITRKKDSYLTKEILLKQLKHVDGYLLVDLYKNNKVKSHRIHRLVMLSFKGTSKLQVNHIDGIKHNNELTNLEYCTAKQNIRHAWKTGLCENVNVSNKIKVHQFDKQNNFIKEYKSVLEAEKQNKISPSNISKCLKYPNRYKTAGGFIWKRA